MPQLNLHFDYSRQEVQAIFSPDTRFTPNSGTWGLHGIIKIPGCPGDFVFFVTFGQHQAGHIFDEWITEEGVISWQSQPRQSFQDRQIEQFMHHNDKKDSIHLFLRTQRTTKYTYLGPLRYLAHDPEREKPVYMYWQLLDWPIPAKVLSRINLHLQPASIYQRGTSQIIEPVAEYDISLKEHIEFIPSYIRKNNLMSTFPINYLGLRELYKRIQQLLEGEFGEIFINSKFRLPNREKWLEVHTAQDKGFYILRMTKQNNEIAYIFTGDRTQREFLIEQISPVLSRINESIDFPINAVTDYTGVWGRFGFIFSNEFINKANEDKIEVVCARLFAEFVRAIQAALVTAIDTPLLKQTNFRNWKKTGSPQAQILEKRIGDIQKVLSGLITTPPDEILCDWVHFCYDFELYREGQSLFSLVTSEQVNSWYYERTKKLARSCSLKAAAKD